MRATIIRERFMSQDASCIPHIGLSRSLQEFRRWVIILMFASHLLQLVATGRNLIAVHGRLWCLLNKSYPYAYERCHEICAWSEITTKGRPRCTGGLGFVYLMPAAILRQESSCSRAFAGTVTSASTYSSILCNSSVENWSNSCRVFQKFFNTVCDSRAQVMQAQQLS